MAFLIESWRYCMLSLNDYGRAGPGLHWPSLPFSHQSCWTNTHLQLLEHPKPQFQKQKRRELEGCILALRGKIFVAGEWSRGHTAWPRTRVLRLIRLEFKSIGLVTTQPHGLRQITNFSEHLFCFFIRKMEMTTGPLSEDYKREHCKAPSTGLGTKEALDK